MRIVNQTLNTPRVLSEKKKKKKALNISTGIVLDMYMSSCQNVIFIELKFTEFPQELVTCEAQTEPGFFPCPRRQGWLGVTGQLSVGARL